MIGFISSLCTCRQPDVANLLAYITLPTQASNLAEPVSSGRDRKLVSLPHGIMWRKSPLQRAEEAHEYPMTAERPEHVLSASVKSNHINQ